MKRREASQAGVVSLMVTLIMMIVITLLVLGFAEVARNEQRSALDAQLSTQAYYAAESGINDARAVINDTIATLGADKVSSNNSCDPQGAYVGLNPTVDAAHNVAYTCLLIDANPDVIEHDIGTQSVVIPIITSSNISTLTLKWIASPGYPTDPATCQAGAFSARNNVVSAAWGTCGYPLVRVDLLDANGGLTRSGWAGNTTTAFFSPRNSTTVGNSVALGAQGAEAAARCDAASARCTATITGLSGKTYYMRVSTLYRDNSTIFITAGGATFVGVQATIDATGRAQDVLRRVKVAVDLTDANVREIPVAAIEVRDSICKRFSVTSNSFQIYSDVDMSAGANGNTYCSPPVGPVPGQPAP